MALLKTTNVLYKKVSGSVEVRPPTIVWLAPGETAANATVKIVAGAIVSQQRSKPGAKKNILQITHNTGLKYKFEFSTCDDRDTLLDYVTNMMEASKLEAANTGPTGTSTNDAGRGADAGVGAELLGGPAPQHRKRNRHIEEAKKDALKNPLLEDIYQQVVVHDNQSSVTDNDFFRGIIEPELCDTPQEQGVASNIGDKFSMKHGETDKQHTTLSFTEELTDQVMRADPQLRKAYSTHIRMGGLGKSNKKVFWDKVLKSNYLHRDLHMDKLSDEHDRGIADFKKDFPDAFPKQARGNGGGGGSAGGATGSDTGDKKLYDYKRGMYIDSRGGDGAGGGEAHPSILFDLAATEEAKIPDGYGLVDREKDRPRKAPERGRAESAPKRRRIAEILNEDSNRILNTLHDEQGSGAGVVDAGAGAGAGAGVGGSAPSGVGGEGGAPRSAAALQHSKHLKDATVDEYLIKRAPTVYAPLVLNEDAAPAAADVGKGDDAAGGGANASVAAVTTPLQLVPLDQTCFAACSADIGTFSDAVLRSPEVARVRPPRDQTTFLVKSNAAIGHALRHFWRCFEDGSWTPQPEKIAKARKMGTCLEKVQEKDQVQKNLSPQFRGCAANITARVACALEKKQKFDAKMAKKGM